MCCCASRVSCAAVLLLCIQSSCPICVLLCAQVIMGIVSEREEAARRRGDGGDATSSK